MSIVDIYTIRIALESALVKELSEQISQAQILELKNQILEYQALPLSANQGKEQLHTELDFHAALAALSTNEPLRFICRFLLRLLRDLTEFNIVDEQSPGGDKIPSNNYQAELVEALSCRDASRADSILCEHLRASMDSLLEHHVKVSSGFLAAV